MFKSITTRPDPPHLVLVLSVQFHLEWTKHTITKPILREYNFVNILKQFSLKSPFLKMGTHDLNTVFYVILKIQWRE